MQSQRRARAMLLVVVVLALIGGGAWLVYRFVTTRPVGVEAQPPIAEGGTAEVVGPKVAEESTSPKEGSSPEHPLPDPRPPADGKPRVWSIVVGIDGYLDNESISTCRGAEFAAHSFARWLADESAIEAGQTLMLIDGGEKKTPSPRELAKPLYPSRQNLSWAFREWLPARFRPDDLVVFFFAGQAVGLPATRGSIPGAPGQGILMPIDARASSADLTGWSLDQAIEPIAKMGKNPILCLLDTSLHGRGGPVKFVKPSRPDSVGFLRTLTRWPGVSAWLAASDRPALQAASVGELSPFTAALIDSFGTRDEPLNLLSALNHLRRDARTVKSGFRAVGNLDVDLTLWAKRLISKEPIPPELLVQRGHARSVDSIAFQSDGGILATGSDDSSVRIWRVADRTLLRVLDRHLRGVTALALSDSGQYLASGDAAGNLQIWNFSKRAFLSRSALPNHKGGIVDLGFLPDSSRLLSRDRSGLCWLTNLGDFERPPKRISDASKGVAIAHGQGPIACAVMESSGKITRFGRDGSPKGVPLDGPGGAVDSDRMATDGTRLAVVDRAGNLVLWDESSGKVLERRSIATRVDCVTLQGDRLVIADGRKLLVFPIVDNALKSAATLTLDHEVTHLRLSTDADILAARTESSTLHVWRLPDDAPPAPLDLQGEIGLATSVAIAPDGKSIAVGNQDGSVQFWSLENGESRPAVEARRGQVASLSVSADGRHLLQVSHDHVAQLWDLFEGRELTVIPPPITQGVAVPEGWQAGSVTSDGKSLVLLSYPKGDVLVLDRETSRVRDASPASRSPFERPLDPDDGKPFNAPFKLISISEGPGRKLVGAAGGSLVCIWDFLTGSLIYTVRGHEEPIGIIRSIDFTPDAKAMLTAAEDGTVQVWDLSRPDPQNSRQPSRIATFSLPGDNPQATAARFLPPTGTGGERRIVSGSADGEILVWEVGKEQPVAQLTSAGPEVTGLILSADLKWLVASGRDKSLRHWRIANGIQSQGTIEPTPNHDEQINSLAAWPGRPVVASGSDDTTVRLWNLETKELVGTLSAGDGSSDWVAYSPNGRFDCAVGAERQLTWLENGDVLPVEQFGETLRIQGLPSLISKGLGIPAPVVAAVERPRLAIDPPQALKSPGSDVELAISLSQPNVTDLRLYQDGIPVREMDDFRLGPGRDKGAIKVKLHNGVNRFYAMAGLPGAIDGRSNEVEVRYDQPDPPGELHILALGVGGYRKEDRKLKYACKDAEDLTAFLQAKGIRASKGLTCVLSDEQVNERAVIDKLIEIRNRVRDRPQDTVAVFLAGHTDLIARRFCLLLPEFPFPDQAIQEINRRSVIEFNAIYKYVSYLGCQNRLLIVDACRSGEILNDPSVQWVRRELDSEAHRGRTSYILAARPGGVAGESEALEHGLLTYCLLQGMGAEGLKAKGLAITSVFKEFPSADRDANKIVTADELRWYADVTVPRLAKDVPLLVQRSGVSRTGTPVRRRGASDSNSAPEPPAPSAIPLVILP